MDIQALRERMTNPLLEIGAVIVLLKELIVLFAATIAFLLAPLAPDLSVTYTSMQFLPNSVLNSQDRTNDGNDSSREQQYSLYEVTLTNNTENELEGIELVVHGIRSISATAVNSTSERIEESREEITRSVSIKGDRAFIRGLDAIPAHARVTVQILGRMYPLLGRPRTTVTAATDTIHVTHRTSVTGIFAALSEYGTVVYLILVLVFGYIGIRRITSRLRVPK